MVDETIVWPAPQPAAPSASALEAAEVRAWRVDKVRQLSRRAGLWVWRLLALCVGAALLFVVLDQVLTSATAPTGRGAVHTSAPRQK